MLKLGDFLDKPHKWILVSDGDYRLFAIVYLAATSDNVRYVLENSTGDAIVWYDNLQAAILGFNGATYQSVYDV